ncbi:MAG TPA: phosphatase PAP2 family protein [Terriglobales bacterium]|nr:phosphatase PAP2 family protein [Terriglobales bacterium]
MATETPAETTPVTLTTGEAGQAQAPRFLLASLRENALLLLLTAVYVGSCYTVKFSLGVVASPHDAILMTYLGTFGFFALAAFCTFALWFIYLRRIKRQPDLLDYVGARLKQEITRDRLCLMLPVILAWPWFVNCFSFMKVLIPRLQPFYLDPYLTKLDRALHFGRQPFEWLAPILNHPLPLFILNWIYAFWFVIFMTVLLLQIANIARRKLRLRYLLAQVIVWILFGNVLATVLSSAGPAYYGLLFAGDNDYDDQLQQIREIAGHWQMSFLGMHLQFPFTAAMMQDILWRAREGTDFLGFGISACPSLHIASSWLIARISQEYGRVAAIFGYGFLALIFLASVQLGWHYAIDGYLGMFGGWLCWHAAGFILSRRGIERRLFAAQA